MTRYMTLLATALVLAPALSQAAVEDSDGDGMFSMAEIKAAYPEVTEETLRTLDGDGDGLLTPEEVAAAEEAGVLMAGG